VQQCGDSIVGSLNGSKMIPPFSDPPTKVDFRVYVDSVVEEFVNSDNDPQSILRFTKRFGPLQRLQRGQKEFSLSLQDWRKHQEWLRGQWRRTAEDRSVRLKVAGKFPPQSWGFESGEHLLFGSSGRVLVVTSSLWRLIQFAWCSVPIDHVRICANPECKAPYFVAKDLRQRFCSEICAQWGQREWKRQWWAAKGAEWRKSRPKATKHSKKKGAAADGTRKAR
jgi:hypothetical protein